MSTDIRAEVVRITPQEAQRLLDANIDNRKTRPHLIDRLARDMSTGEWRLNGEAIKIATDGTLLDGQHRLLAAVLSDTPFETLVVRGLPAETRETMDTGARRNFSDVLRWRGETMVAALAAAIESSLCWDKYGSPVHRGPTHSNAERLAYLDANPEIRDAVRAGSAFCTAPLRIPQSSIAPFIMRINRIAPDEAEQFLHILKTGANIGEDHPIQRLRNAAFRMASSKGSFSRDEYAALLTKAWNAWIKGRQIKALSYRKTGDKAEDFPVLLAPSGFTYDEVLAGKQQ